MVVDKKTIGAAAIPASKDGKVAAKPTAPTKAVGNDESEEDEDEDEEDEDDSSEEESEAEVKPQSQSAKATDKAGVSVKD